MATFPTLRTRSLAFVPLLAVALVAGCGKREADTGAGNMPGANTPTEPTQSGASGAMMGTPGAALPGGDSSAAPGATGSEASPGERMPSAASAPDAAPSMSAPASPVSGLSPSEERPLRVAEAAR